MKQKFKDRQETLGKEKQVDAVRHRRSMNKCNDVVPVKVQTFR